MHIVCLSDYCYELRQIMLLAEGFMKLDRVDKLTFNEDYVVFGKVLKKGVGKEELNEALLECDFITMPNFEHFGGKPVATARPYKEGAYLPVEIWDFIHKENLWHKVGYCDIRDEPDIHTDIKDKVVAYFKRTSMAWQDVEGMPYGIYRPIKLTGKEIHSLPIGILDAYWELHERYKDLPRDIDVGFYFDPDRLIRYGLHYTNRKSVWSVLARADWTGYNAKIGHTWPNYNCWDHPILRKHEEIGGSWIEYMRLLNQTKVIFDALPTRYTQTNRPWEALSSGALCVLDTDPTYVENDIVPGVHCLMYSSSNLFSIHEAMKAVRHLLQPENEQMRLDVAKAGFEYCKKYHGSLARADHVLRVMENMR